MFGYIDIYENRTPRCYLDNYKITRVERVFGSLGFLLGENCIDEVPCSFCTGTDRLTLKRMSFSTADVLEGLCTKLTLLKSHLYS